MQPRLQDRLTQWFQVIMFHEVKELSKLRVLEYNHAAFCVNRTFWLSFHLYHLDHKKKLQYYIWRSVITYEVEITLPKNNWILDLNQNNQFPSCLRLQNFITDPF